ncbi:MAG: LytTR family transcriptional regulator DNA-binding domain-containing protein [Selenomonadaceae bacterium]|nr:LytTR family transcriptional regulator DNA-binding domain-containing protein [Selenomonadaceae bacterium]
MTNIAKFFHRHGIDVHNILYIRHSNGHSHINMLNGTVIDTYIATKNLLTGQPTESFLNINKGIVINLQYVSTIDKNVYHMINGEKFNGRLRTPGEHTQIRNSFYQHKASLDLSPTKLITYCSVLDKLPFPFFVVEIKKNLHGVPVDLIFRYCNAAFEQMEGLPISSTSGKSFYDIFRRTDQKQLTVFSDVANNGTIQVLEVTIKNSDNTAMLYCYSPAKGFVAGMFTVSDKGRLPILTIWPHPVTESTR